MNGVAFAVGVVVSLNFGTQAPPKVKIGGGFAAESAPPIRWVAPPGAGLPMRQAESIRPTVRIHSMTSSK